METNGVLIKMTSSYQNCHYRHQLDCSSINTLNKFYDQLSYCMLATLLALHLMTTICYAVILLATTVSITFSILNIPWQCEWVENCSDGQILMAKCNCDCSGLYLSCCAAVLAQTTP